MAAPDRMMKAVEQALASKYQVLRWVGGGGMAQVYLARHKMTGGMFAVKVLSEYLAQDEAVVERFLLEARTAAALSGHPNIVPIFDIGEQDEVRYLIMQYVDGEDLKTYLARKGRLPVAEAARIVEQIADALQFAHSRRVIHRDLKPSNIRMDRAGRAMVLDFGIAKAGEAPTLLTGTGQRVGTPQYMAPERFLSGECDNRSDLYSLGLVFYELVTGVRPFDGDTIGTIESAHVSKPVPPLRQYSPEVPEAYERIILKLLEKQPADRHPDAAALLAELRAAATPASPAIVPATAPAAAPEPAAEPVPATVRTAGQAKGPKWLNRYWLATVVGLVALGGTGAGIGFFALPAGRTPDPATATPLRTSTMAGEMILVGAPTPFYADVTAVSNTAYKAFCDATGYPYPEAPAWDTNYFFKYPEKPVINVSYEDAAAFARWAGKRLPTAAEWNAATAAPGAGAATVSEWTATTYTPSPGERATVPKLDPAASWFAIKGAASGKAVPSGWPAGVRPREHAVGFRCVKEAR